MVINKFYADSAAEVDTLIKLVEGKGVAIAIGAGFEHGGEGMKEIAQKVVDTIANSTGSFVGTYDWNDAVENKLEAIAKKYTELMEWIIQPRPLPTLKNI